VELVGLVTIFAVFEYAIFAFLVGLARGRTGVVAPVISGNPEFERYFRVQQNTLERLVIFIPSLWVFSYFVNPTAGAIAGVVFIVSRAAYCIGYVSDPPKRKLGYNLGELANNVLMLGSIIGIVYSYVA